MVKNIFSHNFSSFLFVFQIGMVTQYWTKFNVAAIIVSVLLFFIINRITQSNLLFQKAPLDYPFIGKSGSDLS